MYAHELLMQQENLTPEHLSVEAKEYLKDFNTFMRSIAMKQGRAEKAGKEFVISEADMNKSNRLSKSLCQQIINEKEEARQVEEEKLRKEEEERKAIELARQEEEAEIERLRIEKEEAEKEQERIRLEEEEAKKQPSEPVAVVEEEEEDDDEEEGGIFSGLGFHF